MEMVREYLLKHIPSRHRDLGWEMQADGKYHYVHRPDPANRPQGTIIPERPITFGVRIEGQRPNETYEEAKARIEKENKRMIRKVGILLGAVGIMTFSAILIQAFS